MYSAIQHSALSGFVYDLLDSGRNQVGTLSWPDMAIATNARFGNPFPRLVKSKIEIQHCDQQYEIAFTYLTRDWWNDIRFTLVSEGATLASADVVGAKGLFKRPTLTITKPFAGQIIRRSGLFTVCYEVFRDRMSMGTIAEKGGLTVRRELSIDLPDSISAPVQFFLFFLVYNHAYR